MAKKNRDDNRTARAAAAIRAQQAAERRRRLLMIGSVAVVVIAVVIGGFLYQSSRDSSGRTLAADEVPANTTGYAVVVGKADAPRTIAVYEDFQCPICNQFEQTVGSDLEAAVAAGKVKLEYHMISFLDRASANKYSSRALNAALAVVDTSGVEVFQKFHDLLYANQPDEGSAGPSNDDLIDFAVQAGADKDAVTPLINDGAFDQWVVNATDASSQEGVNGTPTVFVDGEKQKDPSLQGAIDAVTNALG